ncbi:branched-chain amino acid transport system II carrier protein [Bacillus anthracis]|nr:branched-chain amino acid transport system II carrier protein [Bacillus anthracis]
MSNKVPTSFIIIIGLMLFALFFGAGNLIFPPMLGQMAGNHVWIANAGCLVTGVGLPLLAITAFVFSGENDLQSLASRVHPVFGIVFTIVLYLAIGPFYAIPRSGNVSFEIGIKPFLSHDAGSVALTVFTILFFTVTCLLSLNPTKIIDIVGKILTPIKLTVIGMLVVVTFIHPIGRIQAPIELYASDSFFKGFQEGYLTLDALGAFVFGIIIVNAIREKGLRLKAAYDCLCKSNGYCCYTLSSYLYCPSYMGASSVEKLGRLNNGAEVLAKVSDYYFGSYGAIFLGVMIVVACLITSVGLITACSSFFHKLFPKISYKKLAIILSVFSTLVANIGLTQLIKISIPVLITMYPIAITLIFLTFLHSVFNGRFEVYQGSLILTFIFSSLDGLKVAGIESEIINNFLEHFLPLYSVGLGWGVPAIIGGVCGYVVSVLRKKNTLSSSEISIK